MKVGLKFCGGCNPYYDRGRAVRNLKERFPRYFFEAVQKEGCYDVVLLICGCTRGCVEYYREAEADRYIVLKDRKEFAALSL